jgi:hypothetical protein
VNLQVSGGAPPYTFSLAAGAALPAALTLSSSGLIQGTPTTPGSYNFTVQVTDTFTPPFKISQVFTLNVLNHLALPSTVLPEAVQNISYSEQIQVAGGTPPYHFVVTPGFTMPPDFTLDASGRVSGKPTTVATDFIYFTVSDSASPPQTTSGWSVSLNVQPPLALGTATTLPDRARGSDYVGQIYIVGGRAPYSVQLTAGALPDGLTITSSAYPPIFDVIGMPTKDGLFPFTIQVSDSYETANVIKQNFQVRISEPMTLTGPAQANILYNQSYSTAFPATGGFPPYTWSISPAPPRGFTFDTATGTFSGMSTSDGASGTSMFVGVQDSSTPPLTASTVFFVLNISGKLKITTSSLPAIATGHQTWLMLIGTGGASPYQWSVSAGALPAGMTLDPASGVISGSPTTSGDNTFTVSISDGNPGNLHQTVARQLTLAVKDPTQMSRNDTIAQATPLSNISLVASISPYGDASTSASDVDVYSMSAVPGTVVQLSARPRNDFLQPLPADNSLQPIFEVVDSNGTRYQNCSWPQQSSFTLPCVNNLPGTVDIQGIYYWFQVPGSGTNPATFYVRVSDARGDARPDFIYTLDVLGVN